MAQQPMNPQPYIKHMESYLNFDGGLNTATSNDNLKDSELVELLNKDLSERGSSTRRTGFSRHLSTPTGATGKNQGFFRYYKPNGLFEDIQAVGGKLYKGNTYLPITDLDSFQTDRFIEAVQYDDTLYIATGTKLVQYDGVSAKVVVPYVPNPLEALYVGTNGLAEFPDNYISDGVSGNLTINGVVPNKRYGVVNTPTMFTAYGSYPAGQTVEYKFEYSNVLWGITNFNLIQDWSTSKNATLNMGQVTDFQIRVSARLVSDATKVEQYIVPTYTVKATDENQTISTSTIDTCNRIMLHWDRLIMYGDTTETQAIFISHLKKMRYFPVVNSLEFKNPLLEPLTSLVRFRDMIVAFTDTSIQALFGKSPADFQRIMIHTGLGCVAPQSAAVMGNFITFLSGDGIYALVSVGTSESRLNVKRLDTNVKNLITNDRDAVGITYRNQYHLVYPTRKERFRFYFELGVWVHDKSDKMDFVNLTICDGELIAQLSQNGIALVSDDSVYTDDGYVYEDIVETKAFDLSVPYNPKKLKELQVLMAHDGSNIKTFCYVYADGLAIINPDSDSSYASVDNNGSIVWNEVSNPNIQALVGTVFGSWTLGKAPFGNAQLYLAKLSIGGSKCLRTSIRLVNKEPLANRFLGLAYVFKLKKP